MDAISRQEVALTLLKNLGSSSRNARDRGGEAANHSKAASFSPSPGDFPPPLSPFPSQCYYSITGYLSN
ncbi:hypothetical protein E2C01_062459 [Portunus trituberculatus]|uniref:Uncharacterized protein n=1 Tax=Portunus trituberculatus TaxID=210409 RepID=A0A5B7H6I0_PORTR|nr:hypothetical protein [Portunus trituberculatus]